MRLPNLCARAVLTRLALGAYLLACVPACSSDESTKANDASGGAGDDAAHGESGASTDGGNPGDDGPAAPPERGDSVLERNNHPSRDGLFVQPSLEPESVMTFASDTRFKAGFPGELRGSPLFFADGPDGKGLFFVATTTNDVVALDENSGAVVWTTNIGTPPSDTGVPCGNIHPLGIVSTPVIDAASRTIYVAGAIGTTKIVRHEVHALSVDTGEERKGFPVDVSGSKSGDQTFYPPAENQRSALSLVRGVLYVAYGGHVGDCGPYHGWVIGIDTKHPEKRGAWASLGQGEGVWAAGGLASDGDSVFAITGNSTVGASDRASSDSEQVLRFTGLAELIRSEKNLFYPKRWKAMDDADADLGASNAVYLPIPGSTPKNYLVVTGKDGHLYLLNSSNLGGMGGEVVDFPVAKGAMAVRSAPTAYRTLRGVYVALTATTGGICPQGSPKQNVVAVQITPGAPPTAKIAWCAPMDGQAAAPITTSTNGSTDATVWYSSDGALVAVDGDTGRELYKSDASCAPVRKWTSPIAVKGRLVVGAADHLCSWSSHGLTP